MKLLKSLLLFVFTTTSCFVTNAQTIGGIGAQLKLDSTDNYTMPKITGLISGSPAAKELKEGWFIIKVNSIDCRNKALEDIVNLIRGAEGTAVKITAADNKSGRHSADYSLVRVSIATGSADPVAAFHAACENESKQLGAKLVKTFNSDCGDYFFNINADARTYHIRMLTMEDKGKSAYIPGFLATARVFDNNNEKEAIELAKPEANDYGNFMLLQSEGAISFKKECVATINTRIAGDVKKCRAMYIIVYR